MKSKGEEITFTIVEVSTRTGVTQERILALIDKEWLIPASDSALDHEDVARLQLIQELESDLGANEEAIPLILHLLDQVCYFRAQLRRLGGNRP